MTSLFQHHIDEMSVNLHEYKNGTPFVPPFIEKKLLIKIIELCITMLVKDQTVMNIEAPCVIVGDLHGHIIDLFNIISKIGEPSSVKYLFLGDLVDRGDFSAEIATIIFLMKILFPENVFLIRGNHEFRSISRTNGFDTQLFYMYNDESIYEMFIKTFSFLPFAATVDDFVVCLHGGIGPNFTSLSQLQYVVRPVDEIDENPMLIDLLWSDPSTSINEYSPSPRELGSLFGIDATKRFLADCDMKFIVRGHECVDEGVAVTHGGRVVTTFSASSYCGVMKNKCGVLFISDDKRYESIKIDPSVYFRRYDANFCPLALMFKTQNSKERPQKKKVSSPKKSRVKSYTPTASHGPDQLIRKRYKSLSGY